MTQYLRRPFMVGNTAVDTHAQPFITGTQTAPDISSVDPLEPFLQLRIETTAGIEEFVFAKTATVSEIITAINGSSADVTAMLVDGVLRIGSVASTSDAFIRILEADGLPNAAPCLGFPVYPHPMATVRNGDLVPAPVRTDVEGNPAGTLFLARGEDRLAKNFNRVLHQLSINADLHEAQLSDRVAEPRILVLEPSDPRLVLDVDGKVLGVNLPEEEYVYIGGAAFDSSLSEIARSFIVCDLEGNPIQTGTDLGKVWVSAVTRGVRASFPGTPSFSSPIADPVSPLANTTATAPDGGNALGVGRVKTSLAAITAVKDATILECASATFISSGVVPYDVVSITAGPTENQGSWIVQQVISETELEIYPATGARLLSDGEGGPLGSATVVSDGKFERDIQVSFTPPISRTGPGFILGYGIAKTRGTVDDYAHLFGLAFNRRALADTWDSVYNGPANNGGGSYARITGHPFIAQLGHDGTIAQGTLVRSGIGAQLLAGNILVAPSTGPVDTTYFTDADLGRVVQLTHGSLNTELATIVEIIDVSSVRLLPYERTELPALTAVSFAIYRDAFHDFPSAILVTSKENYADAGFTFLAENESATGHGFAQLKRVLYTSAGADITTVEASLSGNTVTIPTVISPEVRLQAGSILRLLNGPHAGFYRCITWSTGATTVVTVQTLMGDIPSLSGASRIAFYARTFATSLPEDILENRMLGLHLTGAKQSGRYGALELSGSIFQSVENSLSGSGIFTEAGIGSGRFNQPLRSEAGNSLPATLGQPTIPVASVAATVSAPSEYFSFDHTATVIIASASLPYSAEKLVGCGIAFLTGAPTGLSSVEAAIVGAQSQGSNTYLAIQYGSVSVSSAASPCTVRIYGNRWQHSYVDIANWTLIGTAIYDLENLPLVSAVTAPSIDRTIPNIQLLSAAEAQGKEVGAGVGQSKALADLSSLNYTVSDFSYSTGAHSVDPDAKIVYNGWGTDNTEPRTPFPNSAIISREIDQDVNAGVDTPDITVSYPGTTLFDDFDATQVTQASVEGSRLLYSYTYGGCLRIEASQVAAGPETALIDVIRLKLKPLPSIPRRKFGYTVRIKLQAYCEQTFPYPSPITATSSCTIAVRRADGSVLASEDVSFSFATDSELSAALPQELEATLFSTDFIDSVGEASVASELISDARITVDFQIAGAQTYSGSPSPLAPGIVNLLELRVTSSVKPLRVDAPLYVGNSITASGFRIVPAIHGFQTVSPAEVSLLSGQDYGDNIGVTSYGQQEGNYGVGLLRKDAGASFGFYYQPVFQAEQFFKKTPHSAAIVGYHPYFDPLFYAIANSNGTSLRSDLLPGRTGFLVPLNPPHGATLTSLAFTLSFLPSEYWTSSSDVVSDFQVWSEIPSSLELMNIALGSAESDAWRDPDVWKFRKGFYIKLWRYNALNFGVDAPTSSSYTGSATSTAGFGEVIWQRRMSFSSSGAEPSSFANMGSSSDPLGKEYAVAETLGLSTDGNSKTPATRADALIVDRRHYAYFMTVEFYIGRRQRDSSDNYIYHGKGIALEESYISTLKTFSKLTEVGGWDQNLPAEVIASRFPLISYASSPYNELGGGNDEDWKPRPPVVKFRGARLGWLTDRPGHGGWGG